MKTTLLVPTLNEIAGMRAVMPRVQPGWADQILVVDGGSRDGTAEYAREAGYQTLVQQRKGMRYAYIEAMPYVTGDSVITFSPDGNCIPELIPLLQEEMRNGHDMVIVSRYASGAGSEDDDLLTAFGNRALTWLINGLYGARYTDALGIYRAWRTELFAALDLDKDKSYRREERLFRTTVGVEPLLSIRAAKRKLSCGEIPGAEPKRIGGHRKLQMFRWGAAYLYEIVRERFTWK
ncbi:MAG: glycosyltransferase [Kiritimatiellae bacterium]|nr:glycosyltransferase [Kiritimatiellia bacterium]